MKITQIQHPAKKNNDNLKNQDADDEEDPDIASGILKNEDDENKKSKKNDDKILKSEIVINNNKLNHIKIILDKYKVTSPSLLTDVKRLDVVKFSSELLLNLDLSLKYNDRLFKGKTIRFSETLSYDNDVKLKARVIALDKNGYLFEDSNYFEVEKIHLDEYTNLTTLRNSRVLLYWREVEISEFVVKRLLTLGLWFLINIITKAELIFYIQQAINNNSYNISIKYVENTYVIIGIEGPIFSY
jgi:hypothetical protein